MADAERNRIHDLLTHIQHGKDQENDTLDQYDAECRLKGLKIGHARQSDDVCDNDGKEAVQSHAGRHCKGLVGNECHHENTDCGCNTGCQENTVPKFRHGILSKTGQQVRIQGYNISHGHECGQSGNDLCFCRGVVFIVFS